MARQEAPRRFRFMQYIVALFLAIMFPRAIGPRAAAVVGVYSPWDTSEWEEYVSPQALLERGGAAQITPATTLEWMLPTIPREVRVSLSPSPSQRAAAMVLLQRTLRHPYVSTDTAHALLAFAARTGEPARLPRCSYKCDLTSGVSKSYRILLADMSAPPYVRQLHIYIEGLGPMKSAEDVMVRIRELFACQGELIVEPLVVPSPRTFKIHSKDGNWHFRGGQITLVSTADRKTTMAVNAIAALITFPKE